MTNMGYTNVQNDFLVYITKTSVSLPEYCGTFYSRVP